MPKPVSKKAVNKNLSCPKWSNASLKLILSHMMIEKRETLAHQCSEFWRIDKKVPYHFDEISYGNNVFRTTSGKYYRQWELKSDFSEEIRNGWVFPNETCTVICTDSNKREDKYELKMGIDEAIKTLFKKFTRWNVDTKILKVTSKAPKGVEHFRFNTQHLILAGKCQEDFNSWRRIVSKIPNKEVRLNTLDKALYIDSMVSRCQKLCIREQLPNYHDISDYPWIYNNPHRNVEIQSADFWVGNAFQVISEWILKPRPLGYSIAFDFKNYDPVVVAFQYSEHYLHGVASQIPGITNSLRHCVTFPLNEKLELVVRGDANTERGDQFNWQLKLVVMKVGSTVSKFSCK